MSWQIKYVELIRECVRMCVRVNASSAQMSIDKFWFVILNADHHTRYHNLLAAQKLVCCLVVAQTKSAAVWKYPNLSQKINQYNANKTPEVQDTALLRDYATRGLASEDYF